MEQFPASKRMSYSFIMCLQENNARCFQIMLIDVQYSSRISGQDSVAALRVYQLPTAARQIDNGTITNYVMALHYSVVTAIALLVE